MSDQRDTVRSAPRSIAAPAVYGARGDPAPGAAGQASWCTCSTTAIPAPAGPVIVLRVAGEVDLSTIDLLRTALDTLLAQRPAHLIVDLSALEFCSARGLSLLGQAGDTALGHDVGYAVAAASARLNRVWAMGWTAAQRPIAFPTTADAVLAAMAHQAGAQDRARWEPKHLITALPQPTALPRPAHRGAATREPVVPVPAPVALIA